MANASTDLFTKAAPLWTGQIGTGGVNDDTTTTVPLDSASGLTNGEVYFATIDRVNNTGVKTPTKKEVVKGLLSGSNLIDCSRGVEGTAQAHSAGAVVEILFTAAQWNDLKAGLVAEHSPSGVHSSGLVTTLKATGAVVNTGTSDITIVTPKAIADSNVSFIDGTETLTNKTLTKPTINASVQGVATYTPAGGATATLDVSTKNIHSITMPAGNITIAVSNEAVGQCFLVEITQDDVGSRTVTWFTTIRWADGSAPTLTTTASKRDVFGFRVTGTDTYDGYVVGQNL